MRNKDDDHSLILAKGHSDFKTEPCFSQKLFDLL